MLDVRQDKVTHLLSQQLMSVRDINSLRKKNARATQQQRKFLLEHCPK